MKLIAKLIEAEAKELGDPSKVFLAGFARGACIALTAFLQYTGGPLGGVFCTSGFFCASLDWSKIDIEMKQKTPLHFHHGKQNIDYVVSQTFKTC